LQLVDAKKLEKAEAKIKQKQEKKATENLTKPENVTRCVSSSVDALMISALIYFDSKVIFKDLVKKYFFTTFAIVQ